MDLDGLLGGFITAKKPSKKETKIDNGGDFEFDFDQYTLPDPDSKTDDLSKETDLEMNQLNLPEDQLTDEFDHTVFDKVDVDRKGGELKENKALVEKAKPCFAHRRQTLYPDRERPPPVPVPPLPSSKQKLLSETSVLVLPAQVSCISMPR